MVASSLIINVLLKSPPFISSIYIKKLIVVLRPFLLTLQSLKIKWEWLFVTPCKFHKTVTSHLRLIHDIQRLQWLDYYEELERKTHLFKASPYLYCNPRARAILYKYLTKSNEIKNNKDFESNTWPLFSSLFLCFKRCEQLKIF